MYYLEIVELFDVIETVEVKDKTVTIKGLKDNQPFVYTQSYGYLKVAKEVQKRLKYFIGIKK